MCVCNFSNYDSSLTKVTTVFDIFIFIFIYGFVIKFYTKIILFKYLNSHR